MEKASGLPNDLSSPEPPVLHSGRSPCSGSPFFELLLFFHVTFRDLP